MGKIEKILKKGPVEGQTTEVYPVTSTKAVYDENNKRLDNIITGLQESVYLNTPIPISTDNTTESMAQNVENIADYVKKAKAAGIADVNGMAVTCLIDNDCSGVGYFYPENEGGPYSIFGVIPTDDLSVCYIFRVFSGTYEENSVLVDGSSSIVTSNMLVQGARRPIILTPNTTEIDEETYQKLLSDDVDVVFKTNNNTILSLLSKEEASLNGKDALMFIFTGVFGSDTSIADEYSITTGTATIVKESPHIVSAEFVSIDLDSIIRDSGYIHETKLSPVLQNINLAGTDEERKAKLDQFAADWKALTGANTLEGARFIGKLDINQMLVGCIFAYNSRGYFDGISLFNEENYQNFRVSIYIETGALTVTPLFSHLEQVEIFDDNTIESKQKNIDNLNAYKTNLEYLGVDTSKSFQVPVQIGGYYVGVLYFSYDTEAYKGIYTVSDLDELYYFSITSDGEYHERQVVLQGDTIGSDMLGNAAVTGDNLALNAKPFTMTSTLPTAEEWGQIFEISSKMNYRFLVPVYQGTTLGIHVDGQAATGTITRRLSAYVVTQYQDTENYTVLMVFQGVVFSFSDAGAYPFLQDNIVYRYLYVRNGRPTNFVDKTDVKGATAILSEGLISQSPDYISGKKVNLPQTFGKGSMLYNGNTLWAEVPSLSQVQYDAILAKFKEKFPDTLVGFDRAYREVGSGQKVLIGDDISGITAIISSSYLFFL